MNIIKALFCLVIVVFSSSLSAQQLEWVKTVANDAPQRVTPLHMKIDKLGNLIIAGSFTGADVDFDPGPNVYYMSSQTSNYTTFFAKYDNAGNFLWAHTLDNQNSSVSIRAIEVANDGTIYVAGSYSWMGFDADPGPDTFFLENKGYGDHFIAKYDFNGNFIDARSIGDTLRETQIQISLDKQGNLIVCGTYEGSIDIDLVDSSSHILGPANLYDFYLATYDPNFNLKWVKEFRNSAYVYPNNLMLDSNDNIFLTLQLDTSTLYIVSNGVTTPLYTPNGNYGIYYLKFDNNGTFFWGKSISGAFGRTMIDENSGEIYQIGSFGTYNYFGNQHVGSADFDPGPGNTNSFSKGKTDLFIAKYDSLGNFLWVNHFGNLQSNPVSSSITSGFGVGWLNDTSFLVVGNFEIPNLDINPDPNETHILSTNGEEDGLIACFNIEGDLLWAHSFGGSALDYFHGALIDNQDFYLFGTYESAIVDCDFGPGVHNITNSSLWDGMFFSKYSQKRYNRLEGRVFMDFNGDGNKGSNEPYIKNILTLTTPGIQFSPTDENGKYYSYADTGLYSVTIPNPPPHFSFSPLQHTASFSGYAEVDSNNNFALQPVGNVKDIALYLTPYTCVKPGKSGYYNLSIRNTGNQVTSGFVTVTLDSIFNFWNSSDSVTMTGSHSFIFHYNNLYPLDVKELDFLLYADTSAAIGDTIDITVKNDVLYSPWCWIVLRQIITCPPNVVCKSIENVFFSEGPNDMTVQQMSISLNEVANNVALDYTIRFQNTKNSTVYNITIEDTLSDLLDYSTLQILAASHPYSFRFGEAGAVKFTFDNILLPDSSSNLLESFGFIRYSIKPKKTISAGSTILNSAYFYFDYNNPIQTNTVNTNVIDTIYVSTMPGVDADNNSVNVYPNPANTYLNITGLNKNLKKVVLTDMVGREVYSSKELNDKQHHVQMDFPSGVYVIQVFTGNEIVFKKVIIGK